MCVCCRYGIDPTSTLFKKTQAMKTILEAQRKRRLHEDDSSRPGSVGDDYTPPADDDRDTSSQRSKRTAAGDTMTDSSSTSASKVNTKYLVDKLKRKFSNQL